MSPCPFPTTIMTTAREVVERDYTARKTRTMEFIEKVQVIIDETPQWPIGQIVRELGVSHSTVNACVKGDLKCRP